MKDKGAQFKAPAIAFLVFGWVLFLLRSFIRLRSTRKFLIDDWILALALIAFSATGGLYLTAAYWGFGKHIIDLDVRSQMNALHAWFFTDIFSTVTSCLLRLAAGFHILRHVNRSWQRSVVYIGNSVNVFYSFFLVFVLIFRCKPINWYWQRTAHMQFENGETFDGVCRSDLSRHGLYAESVMSALVDWSFASLPLVMMRSLDISRLQRAAVSVVVLLGQAAGFVIIARIPAYRGLTIHADYTYSITPIAQLTTIESGLIMTALCLASLSPLLPVRQAKRQNQRFARNDHDSETAFRGVPLERKLGTTTIIESTAHESKRNSIAKLAIPLKAKTKGGFTSSDTLVQVLENGNSKAFDGGIVKTTDVITFSDEDLAGKTAQSPATSLKR